VSQIPTAGMEELSHRPEERNRALQALESSLRWGLELRWEQQQDETLVDIDQETIRCFQAVSK
jgi:hypothetical protein